MDENAEKYLAGIPMWAGKKNSLTDIRAYLEELGNPDDRMKFIHVAGTNGKGSVCACLTSILRRAGYHVGTFVSPHLVETRERFLLDGLMVTEKAFLESFQRVLQLSETMQKKGFCHPTYFEFLFYMGLCIFGEAALDYVVLETGLGGRLDVTNVIRRPEAAVITSISFDHMQYLGDTIEKIASEKAGIIKEHVPVIYDCTSEEARRVIEETAMRRDAPAFPAASVDYRLLSCGSNQIRVRYRLLNGRFLETEIPSSAEYQAANALLAVRCIETIMPGLVTEEQLAEGVRTMSWPARMEEVLPGFYLDGAHNEGGIREFVKTAKRLCRDENKRAYVMFGAVSDKAHEQMIQELVRHLPLDGVVAAAMESERGLNPELLKEEFSAAGVDAVVCGSAEEAVKELFSHRDEEHLLFCVGSLYLMGEVKEVLRRNGHD